MHKLSVSVVLRTSAKQTQHRFVRLSLIRLFGQNIGRPIVHEEEHNFFFWGSLYREKKILKIKLLIKIHFLTTQEESRL
jgi:hypothetical protein